MLLLPLLLTAVAPTAFGWPVDVAIPVHDSHRWLTWLTEDASDAGEEVVTYSVRLRPQKDGSFLVVSEGLQLLSIDGDPAKSVPGAKARETALQDQPVWRVDAAGSFVDVIDADKWIARQLAPLTAEQKKSLVGKLTPATVAAQCRVAWSAWMGTAGTLIKKRTVDAQGRPLKVIRRTDEFVDDGHNFEENVYLFTWPTK